tara:strand:+ start:1269 stop:2582 length:1314 start_codon:yes stop_codon:yes gene_type:complete
MPNFLILLTLFLLAPSGFAQTEAAAVYSPADTSWILTAALFVFLMQIGFCMLEMGLARAKNTLNVAMKNVLDFAAASLAFLFFGFTLMFGASMGGIIGWDSFKLWNIPGDSPFWSYWFFQTMFAATACTIASGAMAERTRFLGYLCYTVILSGFIYPLFGHWAWGGGATGLAFGFGGDPGWLGRIGFHDFAGSTVVHAVGGAAALAGIIVVGPRKGRFGPGGSPRYLPGHNLPLATFGTLILWVGWFGFNAGSLLEATDQLGRICVNTMVAGSAGAIAGMALFWVLRGTPNPLIALNGILGGLVAITACCDLVNPLFAVIIGAVAGIISTAGSIFLEKLLIDDVVGAVPVHLFNGFWGTMCVGLFAEGAMFDPDVLAVQAIGATSICLGAFVLSYVCFAIINKVVGLRATDREQEDGLDFSEHSANAYADFLTRNRS